MPALAPPRAALPCRQPCRAPAGAGSVSRSSRHRNHSPSSCSIGSNIGPSLLNLFSSGVSENSKTTFSVSEKRTLFFFSGEAADDMAAEALGSLDWGGDVLRTPLHAPSQATAGRGPPPARPTKGGRPNLLRDGRDRRPIPTSLALSLCLPARVRRQLNCPPPHNLPRPQPPPDRSSTPAVRSTRTYPMFSLLGGLSKLRRQEPGGGGGGGATATVAAHGTAPQHATHTEAASDRSAQAAALLGRWQHSQPLQAWHVP